MSTPAKLKYRPEIDGLRAIAVLAVIFSHAGFKYFKGGFVGVDMFFVISGYLITSIIIEAKLTETFSLIQFYERRARRILPALFLVMLCCLPFAWFWMMPYQLIDFSKSLVAVVIFLSNFLFWKSGGYFDIEAAARPLLHTWSLGVEEQFYLLFPLLISYCWRLGFKKIFIIMLVISSFSLALSEWLWSNGHTATNFFLAPSRAWELLIGSMLALISVEKPVHIRFNQTINNICALLGLLFILYSISFFSQRIPTPSIYALFPTIGTALVIAFANKETIVGRLLSLPLVVGVGLISYSAYLWHQPLFAFARLACEIYKPSLPALCLLTFVLAYLSWRYIEQPFRSKEIITKKQIFSFAIVGSLIFMILGLVVCFNKGFPQRFAEEWVRWSNKKQTGRYVFMKAVSLDAPFIKNNQRKILIIGDSFSQDFVNQIFENNYLVNDQIRTMKILAICQNYLGPDNKNISIANKKVCEKMHKKLKESPRIKEADIIILASAWRAWSAKALPETIENLNLKESQRVFVIGTKFFGRVHPQSLVKLSSKERIELRKDVRKSKPYATNNIMKTKISPHYFINQQELVCGTNKTDCPLFTPDGDLIAYDGSHLTKEGAQYIGQLLFSNSQLKSLL